MVFGERSDDRELHKNIDTKILNKLENAGQSEQRVNKSTGIAIIRNDISSSIVEKTNIVAWQKTENSIQT